MAVKKEKCSIPKTCLYILKLENYFERVVGVLAENKTRNVIYLTTNKPYRHLIDLLKARGIKTEKVFFIDCISKHVGEAVDGERENCVFVDGPSTLTAIGIAINQSVEHISGEKIVVVDSLSILCIYNNMGVMGKFSNFLVNRMRSCGVNTALMVLESDSDKEVVRELKAIVDEVKHA
jgi:KaiC/GvpD/RAD55 family RecA-like ATPase